jgi:hypothetical protein
MRSIIVALILAAGFGFAGITPTHSAPLSSKVIGDIAKSQSVMHDVGCRRFCNRYRCWRRCW